MKNNLSKKAEALIQDFDLACQDWGYQSDRGFGATFKNSKNDYDEMKLKIKDFILKLETDIKKLKKEKLK